MPDYKFEMLSGHEKNPLSYRFYVPGCEEKKTQQTFWTLVFINLLAFFILEPWNCVYMQNHLLFNSIIKFVYVHSSVQKLWQKLYNMFTKMNFNEILHKMLACQFFGVISWVIGLLQDNSQAHFQVETDFIIPSQMISFHA